ncbi:MAG: ECF-type sigma factor [Phycisphaerales bacterium]
MADRDVTTLLGLIRDGDGDAARARLYERVYAELRTLAHAKAAGQPAALDADTTGLVHEAFLRLLGHEGNFENRRHFFGAAARAVEQVLIDKARAVSAQRRGGRMKRVELHEDVAGVLLGRATSAAEADEPADWGGLRSALEALDQLDAREAEVVRLKFYGRQTDAAIADMLGIDTRTVARDWKHARAWLAVRMERAAAATDHEGAPQ